MDSDSGGLRALAIVTVFVLGLALFQIFGQTDQKSQELILLREENSQLIAENNGYQAAISEYKAAIDERNRIIESYQQTTSQMNKNFEALRAENEALRSQNANLLGERQELSKKLEVAESDRQKLFDYGIQLITEKQHLQEQLDEQIAIQKPIEPAEGQQFASTFPTALALVILGMVTGGPLASFSVFISLQNRLQRLLSQSKPQKNYQQARHSTSRR
ncbi:MAG: hypothetical protein AB1894_22295 [Chloroflexota bacterium]